MTTTVCLSADSSLTEIPISFLLSTVEGSAVGKLFLPL